MLNFTYLRVLLLPACSSVDDVFVGIHNRTSEASEESRSHVKRKNVGNVLRNLCLDDCCLFI